MNISSMKAIFIFLLFPSLIFAQYNEVDYELVKTTYQRTFDKELISKYLHSENPEEVKAALLSVSHSEDTSFVYLIKQVDFKEHAELICFVGMVGMASAGKDTEASQWFVMHGNYPHLNGRYSIFAKVIQGMDVVYKIDQNDKILNVQLFP